MECMEYIQIGKIINTHGIKGELKVDVYTDFTEERFKKNTSIYIGEEYEEVTVKSYRMHNGFMLLTLKDLEDINLILKYKNKFIYKASKDIEPCKDGYYFRDLKNLDVYVEGEKVGIVKYAEAGTCSDYLRIKKEDDEEVLVPINNVFIKNVDLENKRIEIVKMEGLLWK